MGVWLYKPKTTGEYVQSWSWYGGGPNDVVMKINAVACLFRELRGKVKPTVGDFNRLVLYRRDVAIGDWHP